MKVNIGLVILKTSTLIPFLFLFPLYYSIPIVIFVTWVYQYIVAYTFGVKVMPTADVGCFMMDDKSRANFMSVTHIQKLPMEQTIKNVMRVMKQFAKSRYTIVDILGDYYYKEIPLEEGIKHTIKKIPESSLCKN